MLNLLLSAVKPTIYYKLSLTDVFLSRDSFFIPVITAIVLVFEKAIISPTTTRPSLTEPIFNSEQDNVSMTQQSPSAILNKIM